MRDLLLNSIVILPIHEHHFHEKYNSASKLLHFQLLPRKLYLVYLLCHLIHNLDPTSLSEMLSLTTISERTTPSLSIFLPYTYHLLANECCLSHPTKT